MTDTTQLETDIRTQYRGMPEEFIKHKLVDAKTAFKFFSEGIATGEQTEMARWFCRILEYLSESQFEFDRPKGIRTYTIEDVTQAFEKAQGEALVELVGWWEDDPDGFRESYPDVGVSGPTQHPWSDETLHLCYRLIREMTPYRLWQFKMAVDSETQYMLKENLLDMATGYHDGKELARVASDMFEKKCLALRKELLDKGD